MQPQVPRLSLHSLTTRADGKLRPGQGRKGQRDGFLSQLSPLLPPALSLGHPPCPPPMKLPSGRSLRTPVSSSVKGAVGVRWDSVGVGGEPWGEGAPQPHVLLRRPHTERQGDDARDPGSWCWCRGGHVSRTPGEKFAACPGHTASPHRLTLRVTGGHAQTRPQSRVHGEEGARPKLL